MQMNQRRVSLTHEIYHRHVENYRVPGVTHFHRHPSHDSGHTNCWGQILYLVLFRVNRCRSEKLNNTILLPSSSSSVGLLSFQHLSIITVVWPDAAKIISHQRRCTHVAVGCLLIAGLFVQSQEMQRCADKGREEEDCWLQIKLVSMEINNAGFKI